MNISEAKKELVKLILATEEEAVLDQIRDFLQPERDWWDRLDARAKLAIEDGVRQLDAGLGVPHESVVRSLKEKYMFLK